MVEDDPTFHTDVDRDMFTKVPLESASSGLSALVTQTTPGVSADSNGLFHGLGDHASNSFSVDGQSITDQQSKVFSNQLPSNSIQSIEVISGAPPAEYGDKTSLVIVATTRCGQGITKPTGSVYASYGSFGSATGGFDLSYGGKNWGNFVEVDGLNTGRFLDPPEFAVFHDKGNEENIFDRIDYNFTQADSVHLDLNYSRSWFQTPERLRQPECVRTSLSGGTSANPTFGNVGNADQHSKIDTYNISPTYTRIISNNSVFNLGVFARRDGYDYDPSANPLADLGPSNLQTSSISQYRTLTNTGVHADYSYVKGVNNIKVGAQYEQTFLSESDDLGVVESTYNSPCVNGVTGVPLPGYSSPSSLHRRWPFPTPIIFPCLRPTISRAAELNYNYFGHTDVKELALYVEDEIKAGNWDFNLGVREDMYNGLTDANQTEPRVGIAYNIKPSGTVISISYARTLETPFNENLVLSSKAAPTRCWRRCSTAPPAFPTPWRPAIATSSTPACSRPSARMWSSAASTSGSTPTTPSTSACWATRPSPSPSTGTTQRFPATPCTLRFPITTTSARTLLDLQWRRASIPRRWPEPAPRAASPRARLYPFRIDHDEKFNETTHVQYTIPGGKFVKGIWGGFNWRFDSGLVAGSTPCYSPTDPNSACPNTSITLPGGVPGIAMVDNNIPPTTNPVTVANVYLPLTLDEEFQAGFACNGVSANVNNPATYISTCPANELSSKLIDIPAPGKGDNDHDPPRIQHRDLFDVTFGKNNIFHADTYKMDLDLTAINVTNKYALYNFLSTFSGTHYVTPRALTAKITLNF